MWMGVERNPFIMRHVVSIWKSLAVLSVGVRLKGDLEVKTYTVPVQSQPNYTSSLMCYGATLIRTFIEM